MFLGFLRIAVVEGPLGTGPTIQIFNDDVVAFTSLIDLMLLLISATFPYLCDCRLGEAEAVVYGPPIPVNPFATDW